MASHREFAFKLLILFFFLVIAAKVHCRIEFTNIKCNSPDRKYIEFECVIKSVNRTYKYGSARTRIHQFPLSKVMVRVQLMKRLNGYKPFLYNLTIDMCKFLKNPNPGDKVAAFFYSLIKPYTNANHSCPYNHDVFVEKVPISHFNQLLTKTLPFPEGDYSIGSYWTLQENYRADATVFFTLS